MLGDSFLKAAKLVKPGCSVRSRPGVAGVSGAGHTVWPYEGLRKAPSLHLRGVCTFPCVYHTSIRVLTSEG